MTTVFKVMAYDITKCGYYLWNGHASEFGRIQSILEDVRSWIVDKTIRETATFSVDGEDVLPAYCFSLIPSADNSTWLLTTWNETPVADGGVQSVAGSDAVGSATVSVSELDPDDIAGFPTYFFVIPEKNLIYSIRPDFLRHNGIKGMQNFLANYVKTFASYAVENVDDNGDSVVFGYRNSPTSPVRHDVHPRFSVRPHLLDGDLSYIHANRDSIRKIIRRDTLNHLIAKHRDLFAKLLENVGLLNKEAVNASMDFSYELEFNPTEDDLNTIISSTLNEDPEIDGVGGRVGFKFLGEQEIKWIDKSYAKDSLDINIDPIDGVFLAEDLLDALNQRLHHLLNMISD